ncbi:hypothetical protein S40285_10324 [Stachybotrys chlorohalonatus IBT 40285]|uniref:Uncharacterized protein n=1 Tax=Stachybotrys chlorohalonatus (strain IBT 40285) TaxID=1283841 RepID=A0A084QF02_STAC4|nr:hypothetical protein S40285_10324 [Stachybotrys chlorohalonata IBT 40285]
MSVEREKAKSLLIAETEGTMLAPLLAAASSEEEIVTPTTSTSQTEDVVRGTDTAVGDNATKVDEPFQATAPYKHGTVETSNATTPAAPVNHTVTTSSTRKSTPADARRQLSGSYVRPFDRFNSIVAGQPCCIESKTEGAVEQNCKEDADWPFLRSDEPYEKLEPEMVTFGTVFSSTSPVVRPDACPQSARASIHEVNTEERLEDGLVAATGEEWPDDTSLDSIFDWISHAYKDPRVPGAYPSSIAEEDEHQTFLTMAGLRALMQVFRTDLSFTNDEEREAMLGIVRQWPSALQGNDEARA